MSIVRWLVRRLAFAVVAIYLVVTVAFGVVAFFPVPGSPPPAPGSPRDLATPLYVRYGNWLVEFTTLQWGQYQGSPVADVVLDALAVTAVYAAPAVLVAYPVGMVLGLHSALTRGSLLDRIERYGSYLTFAVPTFFLGILVLDLFVWQLKWYEAFYDVERGLWSVYNLVRLAPAAVVLAVGVVAVQIRHTRAEALGLLGDDHVKLLRAQGGDDRLLGRRILRQTAAPLISQFVVELLAVLLPGIIAVEVVFGLPGFGRLLLATALARTQPLVLGVTAVTVILGIGGNALADVVAVVVDPRIGSGE